MCRSLDKKRFPVSEAQAGKNLPPMHPYCRSTTIADMPDELLKKLKQSAINPETGERILVPGDMSYEEWYEKYAEGKDGVIAKQKAMKNASLDKEQYEKYKEIFPDEIPDTLEKFKEMKYNNTKKWERLKTEKQDRINAMEFDEMQGLIGKLGNLESRLWYKEKISQIGEKVTGLNPLEEKARAAFELRKTIRNNTRDLMKDEKRRAELPERKGSFEDLMKKKGKKHPTWSRDDILKDIIRSSQSSNEEYDRKAGIKNDRNN